MMEDFRFALRMLVRDPGFAATAVLVLALGTGVNNMMFTLIYSHTLRGLPIERADRVLYISTLDARFPDRALSYQDFLDVRDQARTFSGVAAFFNAPVTVGDEGRAPERLDGTYLSAQAFALIDVSPSLGRVFAADEDRQGAAAVALLGARAWRSRYGGDETILGRSILVNGIPTAVVGVMPDPSGFPSTAEVWLPLAQMPGLAAATRAQRNLRVFGRLRDGVAMSDARAEVEAIVDRIARDNPETSDGLRGRVVPINDRFFGRATDPAWLAFMTVGFLIVVVSCANVANLMLARAVRRAREIAIRGSLGASRLRIIRLVLVEAVVLALAGGALGLGVSRAGVQVFRSGIPDNVLPYWAEYAMDWRVFAALVVVSFGTVVLFGMLPALQASRTDVNGVLRAGGIGAGRASTRRLSTAFLAAEFALTVVLLNQYVASLKNAARVVESDEIVTTSEILTASLTLSTTRYQTADQRLEFFRQLEERLRSVPGVTDVALASALPQRDAVEQRLHLDGRQRDANDLPAVWTVAIGPGYFRTLMLPLARGRDFTDRDGGSGQPHVIVNRRFTDTFFPGEDPIGHRVRLVGRNTQASSDEWLTIIGVAPDIRQRPFPDPDPIVYLPLASAPPLTPNVLVRSTVGPSAMATLARAELLALDSSLPLYRVMTMRQAIEEAGWNGRVSYRLILMLTLLALGLSVVGLYAVTAHSVGQRTREIGIRMALGARRGDVRQLIVRRAAAQVTLGLVLGIAGTFAWEAIFATGRRAADVSFAAPSVLGPVTALLAIVTFAACLVPLRRAARLDPAQTLRQE